MSKAVTEKVMCSINMITKDGICKLTKELCSNYLKCLYNPKNRGQYYNKYSGR